ncbi:YebC/PmpR family DNA-binding transcriptional regulator [Candidatus Wolfebacteria bacterium]|nr:MAG: YebC/PmpR family DNA-binding transcriptional regulator [Candidatus Wolfebacteria bacterium]
MSGHNKWSKIKHKKAATDSARSKVFTKLVKLIQVEAKKADGNVNSPGLKSVIERAKKENMPSDNIDRAVKKGSSSDQVAMDEVTYETYGPGGVAVIIEGLTDNHNRTGAEMRSLLSKNGYALAAPGAASWAFTKSEGVWTPNQTTDISEEDGEKLSRLIDILDDNDDVQDVYTNAS